MTGSLDPPEGLSPAPNHRRHAPSIRVQGLPSPTDVGVDYYSVWLSYTGGQRSRRPEGRGAGPRAGCGPDPASARGGARVPPLRCLRRDACQTRGGRGLRPTHTLVRLDHGGRWKPAARAKDSADTAALPLTVGTGGRPGVPVVRGPEGRRSWAQGGAERLYLAGTTYRSLSLGRGRLLGRKGPARTPAPARTSHRPRARG